MKPRQVMDYSWDKSEQAATYLALIILIGGELLSFAVPSVQRFLNNGGEIILLALALLFVFRLISRHLERTTTAISRVTFSEGVTTVTQSSHRTGRLLLLADDGTKYYHFMTEQEFSANKLCVLLFDVSLASKWTRLVEKKLVAEVEVRHSSASPIFHFLCAEDGAAMVGAFMQRRTGGLSPGETFCVSSNSADGRSLVQAFCQMFEAAWDNADRLKPESKQGG